MKRYRIYYLKDRRTIGMGMSWLQEEHPDRIPGLVNLTETHVLVMTAESEGKREDVELLEFLFEEFNHLPEDDARRIFERSGHASMSVGDVVLVEDHDGIRPWFCDSIGWVPLPVAPAPPAPLKRAVPGPDAHVVTDYEMQMGAHGTEQDPNW